MDNELYHYGIKGMKWGVRRYQKSNGSLTPAGKKRYSTKTKNGETLELIRDEGGALSKALRRVSPKIKEEADKTYYMNMMVNGKNVGNLQLYQKPDKEMNITWGSTKEQYRGRGYMQAAMKLGEQIAKDQGNVKITGELVGNSPDIHTVANKGGYRKVGEIKTQDVVDMWGGLTLVEKDL